MMSQLDFARTQLAIFAVVFLMALDAVNPVKVLLHVFPVLAPWHIAALCCVLSLYVFLSSFTDLVYFGVKTFLHSILSIFFSSVEVVGLGNVPAYGPVIFTGNHANQFVDGMSVMSTCRRRISYLVAQKSWVRPVVGHLAWMMGAVPVRRAQDAARGGTGTVRIGEGGAGGNGGTTGDGEHGDSGKGVGRGDGDGDGDGPATVTVLGTGTRFTAELKAKDKLRLPGGTEPIRVVRVIDDFHLIAEQVQGPPGASVPHPGGGSQQLPFDILPHVDQRTVYGKVLDKLATGGTIGIFPEGGSHDRTDLLPLKVGVALVAYNALEKDGNLVPIVPVGLNYFRRHRFRGRLIVEYGRPTYVDPATLPAFRADGAGRRRVCSELLERIEDSMRSVLVTAPDYDTLLVIHTARRLFQQKRRTGASERQDMSRRFAEGYKRLLLMAEGSPPQGWIDLQDRIIAYSRELSDLGIKDYQVQGLGGAESRTGGERVMNDTRISYHIVHLIFVICVAAVPAVTLNLPVGLIARLWANARRKKALAASKVKLKGMDVMLSEKILLCIVLVPSLWTLYGLLMYFLTDMDGPTLALAIMSMPLASYIGIVTAESGVVNLKDIRPYLMRVIPSARRRLAALPATRKALQADLTRFIREMGPKLGDIYYDKNVDWKEIQAASRRSSLSPETKKYS